MKRQTINAFLHTLLSDVNASAETDTHSVCHSLLAELIDSEIIGVDVNAELIR